MPSPSPTKADTKLDVSILDGFKIDIFFLYGRQDLQNVALSIKNKLSDYGMTNVAMRPSSADTLLDLGACDWSSVRYEPDEESAARKLKSIVEKVALSKNWNILAINKGKTPNYISIFVEDADTFRTIYSRYSTNYMYQRKLHCDNKKLLR
ncbi:MAG: hypothetical protein F6K21_10760 [Symploca sp. SIO2D2]|nr:hypothetical protein [Symploca sp. SIO2D2]